MKKIKTRSAHITREVVEAWKAGDRHALHLVLDLPPWLVGCGPLDVHPDHRKKCVQELHSDADPWESACALRAELLALVGPPDMRNDLTKRIADAEEMVAHYQHKVDVPHYGGSDDMPTRREKLARELERVAALQLELAEEMARAETK